MSGYLGDLSPEQETALTQFKANCADVLTKPSMNDYYCLRFLRARAFNAKKAEEMLRSHLNWRETNKIDSILTDFQIHPVMEKYFVGGTLAGKDKEGRPVDVQRLGELDIKGLLKCFPAADVKRAHIHTLETMQLEVEKASNGRTPPLETVTSIVDVGGLSSRHLWRPGLKLFVELMAIQQDNYPESLERVLIIRAPRIFPTIYNMVKGVFDARTRSKFDIVSGDWQKRLKEFIPEETLPPEYGGTGSWGTVRLSGIVPKELWKTSDDSFEKHTVGAGKAFLVEFQVEIVNSVIAWDFFTEEHDIGFSLHHTTDDQATKVKDMTEILTTERHPAGGNNIEGTHIAEKIGRYVLRFDNTYSMFRSKNLFYKTECVLPDEKVVDDPLA